MITEMFDTIQFIDKVIKRMEYLNTEIEKLEDKEFSQLELTKAEETELDFLLERWSELQVIQRYIEECNNA